MTRHVVPLSVLILVSIACSIITPTAAPVTSPQPAPTATATPEPADPLPTISLTYAVYTSAYVLPSAVHIRKSAGGDPTGKYLYVGDRVVILLCLDDWCRIEARISGEQVRGWVWRGCLSNVAGALLCSEAD